MAPLGEGPASGGTFADSRLGMDVFVGRDAPAISSRRTKWFNLAAVKATPRRSGCGAKSPTRCRTPRSPWRNAPRAIAARNAAAPAQATRDGGLRQRAFRLRCGRRLVHLGESRWRFGSKACSDRDLATPPFRESAPRLLLGPGSSTKPVNWQAVLSQERFECRQRHLVFLDVEHQVATFVGW